MTKMLYEHSIYHNNIDNGLCIKIQFVLIYVSSNRISGEAEPERHTVRVECQRNEVETRYWLFSCVQ